MSKLIDQSAKPEDNGTSSTHLSRRNMLTMIAGTSALALAGCATGPISGFPGGGERRPAPPQRGPSPSPRASVDPSLASAYGPMPYEQFPIPAVDLSKVESRFLRREVNYETNEQPGTIIVDTGSFYLYHVGQNGTALRYGCGLGRQGFEWSGRAKVQYKKQWPTWTPPAEMIDRQPELAKYSADNGGMPAGIDNPLGARALYIFEDGRDTLYRIHGSPEYWSIGKAVSSGCVRLMNQDIIHLYDRVATPTPIVVL